MKESVVGTSEMIEVSTVGKEDEVSLGMLTFQSAEKKISFYKKLKDTAVNEEYTFFDNQTLEERTRDKRLGLLKHIMLESGEFEDTDVKIRWRQKMLVLREKKVAWYDADDVFRMTKRVKQFECDLNESLEKWVKKKKREPETDSD